MWRRLNVMARFYLGLRELTHLWGHRRLLIPFKPSNPIFWISPGLSQTLLSANPFPGPPGVPCPLSHQITFPVPQAGPRPSVASPWLSLRRSRRSNKASGSYSTGPSRGISPPPPSGTSVPGWRLQRDFPVHSQEWVRPCMNKSVYSIVHQQTQWVAVLIFASTSQISKLIT